MVTHQLQVERRTAKERRPETDVLPLSHADNVDDIRTINITYIVALGVACDKADRTCRTVNTWLNTFVNRQTIGRPQLVQPLVHLYIVHLYNYMLIYAPKHSFSAWSIRTVPHTISRSSKNSNHVGSMCNMSGQCAWPGLQLNYFLHSSSSHNRMGYQFSTSSVGNWLNILWLFCVLTCSTTLLGGRIFQTVKAYIEEKFGNFIIRFQNVLLI